LFDVGTVSQADVVRVQSQVASAELLLVRAQNLAEVTREQVRAMLHVNPGTPISVGDDVRQDLAPISIPEFATAYDQALGRRPELQALTETIGSLRQQAAVSRATAWPRIEAFADALLADPNPRVFPPTDVFTATWDVGVGLTWSPNDTATGTLGGRAADARTVAMDAQRQGVRDQLRTEVMQALTAARESDVALRTTAAGLAASEDSYRVRRVLFRHGRATSVELTDAESDLTRSRLDALNARVDLRVARARLQHVLGLDTRSSAN
jgi:outer membrane protein TolC